MVFRIDEIRQALEDTQPAKRREMTTEKLVGHEQYFAEQIPYFGRDTDHQKYKQQCRDRMVELRSEIERRFLVEQSERQHQKSYKIEKWILFWAVISGVTGLLILIAEYVPLIRDTFFSKVQPASAQQATLETPPQSQLPTSVSPEPAASSNSAIPSPEQTVTEQPSPSPTTPP